MKKILSIILSIIVVLSTFSFPTNVIASTGINLEVIPTEIKIDKAVGEEITVIFEIKLTGVTSTIGPIEFVLVPDNGVTLSTTQTTTERGSGYWLNPEVTSCYTSTIYNITNNKLVYTVSDTGFNQSSVTIMTIEATIDGSISGNIGLNITNQLCGDLAGETEYAISVTSTPITVNRTITEVNITDIEAPVKKATPDTTATASSNLSVSEVSWTPNLSSGTFAANTAYTASVTVTPDTNYTFDTSAVYKINGETATVADDSNGAKVLTYTFPATEDKTIESIAVTKAPTNTSYKYNESFDSSGMEVTGTYDTGETAVLASSDYTVVDGGNLAVGKTSVTIALVADSVITTTQDITVSKADANVTKDYSVSLCYSQTSQQTLALNLPADAGTTTYKVGTITYEDLIATSEISVVNGSVSYHLSNGLTVSNVNNTVTVPIIATMQNYNDVIYNLNITIIDKASETLSITQSSIGYGETLPDPTYTIPEGAIDVSRSITYTGTGDTEYASSTTKPTAVGTYKVTVKEETETTSYSGEATFNISAKDLSNDATITVSTSETYTGTYTGKAQVPTITVKSGTTDLTSGTDYTVTYSNNTNAGTATIQVAFKGNYIGNKTSSFEIAKAPLKIGSINVAGKTYDDSSSATVNSVTFTGLQNSESLVKGTDYTIDVTFDDQYVGIDKAVSGTLTLATTDKAKNYEMNSTPITNLSTTADITAKEQTLTIPTSQGLRKGGSKLDLTTIISGNVGDLTFTLEDAGSTGSTLNDTVLTSGNVTGEVKLSVASSEKDMNDDGKAEYASVSAQAFTVNIIDKNDVSDNITFTNGTITYSNATATYEKATYNGAVSGTGSITYTYAVNTGNTGTLKEGLPYNVGTYTVTAIYEDDDNYGTKSVTFTVAAKALSTGVITLGPALTYTGDELTQTVASVVVGEETLDATTYTVSNNTGTDVDTYTLKVTANADTNYTGSIEKEFSIVQCDASQANVVVNGTYTYDGSAKLPTDLTVTYNGKTIDSSQYSLTYSNNVNASSAANVIVTFKDNYTGKATGTFTIGAKDISSSTVGDITSITYSGDELKPTVVVKDGTKTLTNGTDYEVVYTNNTAVGTGTATIKGIGNYTKSISQNFAIIAKNISSSASVAVVGAPFTYSGIGQEPSVTVLDGTKTLTNGTDYTVDYENNIKVGQATATVNFQGNYSGSKPMNFTIDKADISVGSVVVTAKTFDGTTDATVTINLTGLVNNENLVENTDYKINTATFEDMNVGVNKSVTGSIELISTDLTQNYNLLTTSFSATTGTITQATGSAGTTTAITKVSDTTEQVVDITKFIPDNAGTITGIVVTESDDSSGIIASCDSNVDNKQVTYVLTDALTYSSQTAKLQATIKTQNYTDIVVDITVNLTEKDVPVITVENLEATYTGAALFTDDSITGTATFDGNTVEGSWKFAADGLSLIDVADSGYQTVTFTPDSTSEYETVSADMKVTINKAVPVGTPSVTKVTASGKTLAVANLSIGTITPTGGTISWVLDTSTVITQGTSYTWKYEPADSANYSELTGTIILWEKTVVTTPDSTGGTSTDTSTSGSTDSSTSGSTDSSSSSTTDSSSSTVTTEVTEEATTAEEATTVEEEISTSTVAENANEDLISLPDDDTPVIGQTEVAGNSDAGTLNTDITEKMIESVLETALNEAVRENKEDNGIIVEIYVEADEADATNLNIAISKEAMEKILDYDTLEVRIISDVMTISLTKEMVEEILSQVDSSVSIIGVKMEEHELTDKIGDNCTVYEFYIVTTDGRKVSDFGGGSIRIGIPFVLEENQSSENIFVYYISDEGEITQLSDIEYNKANQEMEFVTNHFSQFAVSYIEADEQINMEEESNDTVEIEEIELDVQMQENDSNGEALGTAFIIIIAIILLCGSGIVVYILKKKRNHE